MNPCDVGGILTLLYGSIVEGRISNQLRFMEELFDAYLSAPQNADKTFDGGAVSKCLSGSGRLYPEDMNEYYRLHPDALITDIEQNIVPLFCDTAFVVETLHTMLLRDRGISDTKKEALCQHFPCRNSAEVAKFIGEALLNALSRPFVKRTEKMSMAVASGQTSPSIMGCLVDGSIPKPCRHFCGREAEIVKLHQLLENHDKVFLHGIAGMGKSELAKAYAKIYKAEYTNLIYLPYSGSLYLDIANLEFIDDLPNESEQEHFRKHNRFLRTLRSDTLLVVDNFNVTATQDEIFSVLLKYRCSILFTTRSKFEEYVGLNLGELESPMELVEQFFKPDIQDKAMVEDLIAQVHRHTFAVELIARMLRKSTMTPMELLQRFQAERLARSATDKIHVTKDGAPKKDTYYQHIHVLFSLYYQTAERQNILVNMAMVPHAGISKRRFTQWLAMKDGNQLDELVELGFVMEGEAQLIFLQPMMQEVVLADLSPSITGCATLCNNMKNICLRYGAPDIPRSLIFHVTENIIKLTYKNDAAVYLRFLEDVIPSMIEMQYQAGIDLAIHELTYLLSDQTIGLPQDRAVLLDYQAYLEKSPQKAIGMGEKAMGMIDTTTQDTAMISSNLHHNMGTRYLELAAQDITKKRQINTLLQTKNQQPSRVIDTSNLVLAKEHTEIALSLFIAHCPYEKNSFVAQICQYVTILSALGEFGKAKDGILRIEDLVRQVCGERTLDYAMIMRTMCTVFRAAGHLELAQRCHQKAESILQEIAQNNKGCLLAQSTQKTDYFI